MALRTGQKNEAAFWRKELTYELWRLSDSFSDHGTDSPTDEGKQ